MYDFTCVDAHVHPFIEPDNNIGMYGTPESPEDMVNLLKDAGITLCCGSVIHKGWRARPEAMQKCNADCFKFAEMFPDFVIPGLIVHAAFPEGSCAEIEKYHKTGKLHWLGEIVPYTTGTSNYAMEELFPVYELASDLGLPINIHPVTAADVAKVAELFPKLNVIMAHPGEKASVLEKLELMKNLPNLHLDLCGTGMFRWGMLKYAVSLLGAERFLFGSDFPVCNAAMNRAAVLSEKLKDDEFELIFSGNFRRLAHL